MKTELTKGFLLAELNQSVFRDKDHFIDSMEDYLGRIKLETPVEECVEELIEEGWIEQHDEGNNLEASYPDNEVQEA